MPKQREGRIYWRTRGAGPQRAYGDFRDYADVGGALEALIVPGTTAATTDADTADTLCAARLSELESLRRSGVLTGLKAPVSLAEAVEQFLTQVDDEAAQSGAWRAQMRHHLAVAVEFFGADTVLDQISVGAVKRYAAWLARTTFETARAQRTKTTLSAGSRRKYLNTLGLLFEYAQDDETIAEGHNPVRAMRKKPEGPPAIPASLS